jgi:hypothetical protein
MWLDVIGCNFRVPCWNVINTSEAQLGGVEGPAAIAGSGKRLPKTHLKFPSMSCWYFASWELVRQRKIVYVSEPEELVSILFVTCNKSQRTLGFTLTHCDYCLDSKTSQLLSEPSLSLPLSLGEEGSKLEVSPSDILFTSLFFWGRELAVNFCVNCSGRLFCWLLLHAYFKWICRIGSS